MMGDSSRKEEAIATMKLMAKARKDVKEGRVISSSDMKERLAERKRKLLMK